MKRLIANIVGLTSGIIFGLIVTGPIIAQGIPTISTTQAATCVIDFDQIATTLAAAQAYRYEAKVDNGASTVINATCVGTASPFTCTTPLPNKTVGTHTVTITAAEVLTDGTVLPSTSSAVFTYRIANPPTAPTNLRLRIG